MEVHYDFGRSLVLIHVISLNYRTVKMTIVMGGPIHFLHSMIK